QSSLDRGMGLEDTIDEISSHGDVRNQLRHAWNPISKLKFASCVAQGGDIRRLAHTRCRISRASRRKPEHAMWTGECALYRPYLAIAPPAQSPPLALEQRPLQAERQQVRRNAEHLERRWRSSHQGEIPGQPHSEDGPHEDR